MFLTGSRSTQHKSSWRLSSRLVLLPTFLFLGGLFSGTSMAREESLDKVYYEIHVSALYPRVVFRDGTIFGGLGGGGGEELTWAGLGKHTKAKAPKPLNTTLHNPVKQAWKRSC